MADMPTLDQIRENVKESLRTLRQDHKRSLNPTPYKVSTSTLYICTEYKQERKKHASLLRNLFVEAYLLFCVIVCLKKRFRRAFGTFCTSVQLCKLY